MRFASVSVNLNVGADIKEIPDLIEKTRCLPHARKPGPAAESDRYLFVSKIRYLSLPQGSAGALYGKKLSISQELRGFARCDGWAAEGSSGQSCLGYRPLMSLRMS